MACASVDSISRTQATFMATANADPPPYEEQQQQQQEQEDDYNPVVIHLVQRSAASLYIPHMILAGAVCLCCCTGCMLAPFAFLLACTYLTSSLSPTVDVGIASTHSRAGLIKLERQGWVFYGSCMVRKALGLMEIGPPVRPHKVNHKVNQRHR